MYRPITYYPFQTQKLYNLVQHVSVPMHVDNHQIYKSIWICIFALSNILTVLTIYRLSNFLCARQGVEKGFLSLPSFFVLPETTFINLMAHV